MYQKESWRPYGLAIVYSIVYGPKERFEQAVGCHDLVAEYLDTHEEARKLYLRHCPGYQYFDILHRARTYIQYELPFKQIRKGGGGDGQ